MVRSRVLRLKTHWRTSLQLRLVGVFGSFMVVLVVCMLFVIYNGCVKFLHKRYILPPI